MENESNNLLKFGCKHDLPKVSRQLHRSKNYYIFLFCFNFLWICFDFFSFVLIFFGSFSFASIDLGKVTLVQ